MHSNHSGGRDDPSGSDPRAGIRIGCDVGGTFTDFVLADASTHRIYHLKVPSSPSAPSAAVLDGLATIVRTAGANASSVDSFVHGTTLALNTIIQRTGAATGLIVTRGFRDTLELARLRLPEPTDYFGERPTPLVPRRLIREVSERMLASGEPHRPLDEAEVVQSAGDLVDQGIQALAISFLHAYANPRHEEMAVRAVRKNFPRLFVCASSEVWPQRNEYERTLVTVMNAYVGESMAVYFAQIEDGMAEMGIRGTVFSTRSNGGVMTIESTTGKPVATLLSGPASGVMGALHVAHQAGFENIVTFDMGGTSADVSLVRGEPGYSSESQVGGLPCIMPAVDIASIGAGGGSIGWTDSGGALKVGPKSAGSDPGPACYGQGGVDPTITDAYLELGLIHPDRFLGGDVKLDSARATLALARLGATIGRDPANTAAGMVEVATANMHAEFMPLMASKGADPRDLALVAYGGAGPTHAFLLAREIGIGSVVIPRNPGTLCAVGCLTMDLKNDFVATLSLRVEPGVESSLEDAYQTLESEALQWLEHERVEVLSTELVRSADIRYVGQSFEIPVVLPPEIDDSSVVRRLFLSAYRASYGFADDEAPAEVMNARVTVVGSQLRTPVEAAVPSTPSNVEPEERSIYHDGAWITARIYEREGLTPGTRLSGPCIVEQYDTTVFITPEYTATIDAHGNIVAEHGGHDGRD